MTRSRVHELISNPACENAPENLVMLCASFETLITSLAMPTRAPGTPRFFASTKK